MDVPYQHLSPMTRQMCGRNRTRAAEGMRDETIGLKEIDMEVNDLGKMGNEDNMIADITRTGATWTRSAAYWAGQAEDKTCQLCGQHDEDSWHFWVCPALAKAREEADKELAELDPKILPMPVRHGIAPAMTAKGSTTFWGTDEQEENTYNEKVFRMLGGCRPNEIKFEIKEEMQRLPIQITAREYVQHKVDAGSKEDLPTPEKGRAEAAGLSKCVHIWQSTQPDDQTLASGRPGHLLAR